MRKRWLHTCFTLVLALSLSACGSAPSTNTNGAEPKPAEPTTSEPAAPSGSSSQPSDSAQTVEPMDLSIFSGFVSGTEIAMWVAYDNNLFQKYGINPKWNFLPPPTGVQALLSKDVQIGTAPGSAISAFAMGSKDLVFVAGNDDKPVYRIMSKTLSKPEDIKGKKLGVSGKYAPPAVAAMNYMEKHLNMKPDVDYQVVPFQTISDLLPALSKGVIDAAVLSTPLHLKAEGEGIKTVVNLSETFDEANAYIMTTRTFAQENPEGVKRFLQAYAAGIALAKKEPETAIASILKYSKGITEEEAKVTYEEYINLLDVNMNPEALKPYQIYTDNAKANTVNAVDMMDDSFLKQLDESGFLKEQGFTFKPIGK